MRRRQWTIEGVAKICLARIRMCCLNRLVAIAFLRIQALSILCLSVQFVGCMNRYSVSLCYDPVLEATSNVQELRSVATYSIEQEGVKEIVNWLRCNDHKRGSYAFCGVACYIVCEFNSSPVCVAEILRDQKTIAIVVPFGFSERVMKCKNGYYVKDLCDSMPLYCFEDREFARTILELKNKCSYDFDSIEIYEVNGFGD